MNAKKYTTVKQKFDIHLSRGDVLFTRAKFEHNKQEEGESVGVFIYLHNTGKCRQRGFRAQVEQIVARLQDT